MVRAHGPDLPLKSLELGAYHRRPEGLGLEDDEFAILQPTCNVPPVERYADSMDRRLHRLDIRLRPEIDQPHEFESSLAERITQVTSEKQSMLRVDSRHEARLARVGNSLWKLTCLRESMSHTRTVLSAPPVTNTLFEGCVCRPLTCACFGPRQIPK